jgi:general stress protein CsbA
MKEIYTAEWEATRSGYNTGQLISQGMDFLNFHYNVIPNIVFIIHVLNASYRPNILRSYQMLTLDVVAFIIVSEIINKSLNETWL